MEKNTNVEQWAENRLCEELLKGRAYQDFGDNMFYKQLICAIFQNQRVELLFPGMEENISKIVKIKCYKILEKL